MSVQLRANERVHLCYIAAQPAETVNSYTLNKFNDVIIVLHVCGITEKNQDSHENHVIKNVMS
jgi:hypothetical protein